MFFDPTSHIPTNGSIWSKIPFEAIWRKNGRIGLIREKFTRCDFKKFAAVTDRRYIKV